MLPVGPAGLLGLDELEHRAEHGRGDPRPVEPAGVQQCVAHLVVEEVLRPLVGEQGSVDVGELRHLLGHPPSSVLWGVEDLEQGVEA